MLATIKKTYFDPSLCFIFATLTKRVRMHLRGLVNILLFSLFQQFKFPLEIQICKPVLSKVPNDVTECNSHIYGAISRSENIWASPTSSKCFIFIYYFMTCGEIPLQSFTRFSTGKVLEIKLGKIKVH